MRRKTIFLCVLAVLCFISLSQLMVFFKLDIASFTHIVYIMYIILFRLQHRFMMIRSRVQERKGFM